MSLISTLALNIESGYPGLNPLKLTTEKGQIWITQVWGIDDCGVEIDPSQLPTLMQWLQEAAAEIESKTSKT